MLEFFRKLEYRDIKIACFNLTLILKSINVQLFAVILNGVVGPF